MCVAIYARYSSDLQSERSIDDQVAACGAFAQRKGISAPYEIFADAALSGASIATRAQLLRIMDALRAGRVTVLIAEALDRLSRDQADIALIHRAAVQAGAKIYTIAEGEVSHLHIGLAGTMNHLFLLELGRKTRRGLIGVAQSGRSAGSRCYGYRAVTGAPGVREINEDEAAIVRRVFNEYVAGDSPRAIVRRLNAEAVPSPRGGSWRASTLNGGYRARDGLLCQELYRGRLIYNRRTYRKNPETGRRSATLNPESEWIVVEKLEMRIVDEELWLSAQSQRRSLADAPLDRRRRPRSLLSGFLRCTQCGGAFIIVGRRRYGCGTCRDTGRCDVRASIRADVVERRVLDGIRSRMLAPDMIMEAVRAFSAEWKRLSREHSCRLHDFERDLGEARRRAKRIADKIIDFEGLTPVAMKEELREVEARIEALQAQVAPVEPVSFHPGTAELVRRRVAELEAALMRPASGVDAREALRGLVARVDLERDAESPDGWRIVIHGQLSALLDRIGDKYATPAVRATIARCGY